jgi:hypothetical protein
LGEHNQHNNLKLYLVAFNRRVSLRYFALEACLHRIFISMRNLQEVIQVAAQQHKQIITPAATEHFE